MTDESPVGGGCSGEERELAGYLDELISATRAERAAPEKSIEGPAASRGRRSAHPQSQEPEESTAPEPIAPEPTSPSEAPPRKPPTSARQARGAGRASMREELLALFRDTDRAAPLPPSLPAPPREPALSCPRAERVLASVSAASRPLARTCSLRADRAGCSFGRGVRIWAARGAGRAGGRQDGVPRIGSLGGVLLGTSGSLLRPKGGERWRLGASDQHSREYPRHCDPPWCPARLHPGSRTNSRHFPASTGLSKPPYCRSCHSSRLFRRIRMPSAPW